jgi:hypothetical protein
MGLAPGGFGRYNGVNENLEDIYMMIRYVIAA